MASGKGRERVRRRGEDRGKTFCFRNKIFKLNNVKLWLVSLSIWSRGMIPASGAGGPGFDPRNGPGIFCSRRDRGRSNTLIFQKPAANLVFTYALHMFVLAVRGL